MMLLLILMAWANIDTAILQERALAGRLAYHDLLAFAQLNTPHPFDRLNPRKSRYEWLPHHRLIANRLQDLEAGRIKALEIEMPPRYSKSELAVRNFVSWHAGRHPEHDLLVVTATADLATEHGRDVRDYMRGPGYKLAFGHRPESRLRDDSQAAARLQLEGGGKIHFFGRGQIPAGVGGMGIVFDDFFKNAEDAYSLVTRDSAWRNYVADCLSRLNNAEAWRLLIGSRKHEDDVQGRQFDPLNFHYDERSAKTFVRIRIPALSEGADVDPLGRAQGESCWPTRFPKEFYEAKKNHKSDVVRIDFQTQDQCNPTPTEGEYFKKKWLVIYRPEELPNDLRIYAASDHAYRKDQANDRQCLLVVGVDASGTIWLLPDTWWERADTGEMVEAMINLIASRQPVCWWAARDAISGSVGPFLNKRMKERNVFGWVNDDLREDKDLQRRAQSIRNRMAMGMIRFPVFAPWWAQAEKELMTFPNGKHDDLIAALAMLGMGLDQMHGADGPWKPSRNFPKPQTMAWVKGEQERTAAEEAAAKENKGW